MLLNQGLVALDNTFSKFVEGHGPHLGHPSSSLIIKDHVPRFDCDRVKEIIVSVPINELIDPHSLLKNVHASVNIGTRIYLNYFSYESIKKELEDNAGLFRKVFINLGDFFLSGRVFRILLKSNNSVIFTPELIGRMIFLGYELVKEDRGGGRVFISAKTTQRQKPLQKINSKFIVKLKRIGYRGELINIYKLRTMLPYSELTQQYYLSKIPILPSGKMSADPRVSKFGQFLRKHWLDEIPQLFQVFCGTVRLVGLRPIGATFLSKYPEDLRITRHKYLPGILPVTANLSVTTLDEIFEAERKYLEEKRHQPHLTDLKYFF